MIEDQFLSSELDAWARQHRATNLDVFNRCEELNRDAYALLGRLDVHTQDIRDITVSCLFARSLEIYQALILIVSRGMLAPAQLLQRALLEAMFTIVAVAKDDVTLQRYIDDDKWHQLNLARAVRKTTSPDLERLRAQVTDEMVASFEAAAKAADVKPLKTDELASLAGFHDWYVVIYKPLTGPVHSKVRDLQRYAVVDEKGELQSLQLLPSDRDTRPILATAGRVLLNVLAAIDARFKISLGQRQAAYDIFFESVLNE